MLTRMIHVSCGGGTERGTRTQRSREIETLYSIETREGLILIDSHWLSELGSRIRAAARQGPYPDMNAITDETMFQYHDPRPSLWDGKCMCGQDWPCQSIRGLASKYGVEVPN